eukprot:50681_1
MITNRWHWPQRTQPIKNQLKSKNILVHVFDCRFGLAHHYSHDEFSFWLYNKLRTEIKLIDYELKPRKLNRLIQDNIMEDDQKDSNEKPDIWIHEQIQYDKYSVSKIILDTTITNIFCLDNRKKIRKNEISHFMAGKLGEIRKKK